MQIELNQTLKKNEISTEKQIEIFSKEKLSKKDFEYLYQTYYQKVYDFTLRRVSDPHVAEDLTSSIFEKIVKSLNDFQWQGITVSAWIFRIARNMVIDHYRKNNKHKGDVSLDLVSNFIESKSESALEMLIDDEIQIKLYNAIREFRDEDQYLIYYKYFEGLSNKEISDLMQMSETNIGTRLHRIRKKLRQYLNNENDSTDQESLS